MKKIKLDLDALKVESFVTSGQDAGESGTVFAMAGTVCEWTCNGVSNTCDQACVGHTTNCNYTYTGTCCGGQTGTFGCLSQIGCNTWEESCVGQGTCNPCVDSCESEECIPE